VATESDRWQPTDVELVNQTRAGDHSAFHELMDRHAPTLFALAVALSGHAADAEDIVQETFAGAFRGLGAFQGRATVKTWLTRILIRQTARHHRAARKRKTTLVSLTETSHSDAWRPSPQSAADARMDVTAAIKTLGPEHQEVVLLREIQGLSYEEMAEILEIPRGTVESRLFRARRELQKRLKEYLD